MTAIDVESCNQEDFLGETNQHEVTSFTMSLQHGSAARVSEKLFLVYLSCQIILVTSSLRLAETFPQKD